MTTPQYLTLFALGCIVVCIVLARQHLFERTGLRYIFAGLAISGVCGVAISFLASATIARAVAIPMLTGIALVVRGIHLDNLQMQAEPIKRAD